MDSHFSRRHFLAGAGILAAVPPRPARAANGGLKITKFVTHKATIGRRAFLFLEIHTDKGITGLGEASLPDRVDIVEQAVHWLGDRMTGIDPAGIEEHWDSMYYRMSRWRAGSVLMTALSAVDIALWDIEGKRLGVPVWRLLGGPIHSKLRVYYSHWDSYMNSRNVEDYERLAVRTREQGWTAVKWIVAQARTDAERIEKTEMQLAAVRKAVGRSLDVGLELVERFSVRSAIEFGRAIAKYHPMFIEEPTLREDPQGLAEVAANSPVPVATGEGLLSRWEFRPLLDAKGAAIIQPDVIHCGGITEMRKIANLAETYGVEVAPHQWYGPVAHIASIQSICVCRNFLMQEWDGANDETFLELTKGTYPVQKDGYVTLPQGPGLGLQMDFDLLAKKHPYTKRTVTPESLRRPG